MQQSEKNKKHLFDTVEILKPFCLSRVSIKKKRIKHNSFYREMQTLKHKVFTPIYTLFHDTNFKLKPNKIIKKVLKSELSNHLSLIAIAAWFCGDGGKRDYGINEGKAIQFHSQSFTKIECELLANILNKKYGWTVSLKLDYTEKNKSFYLIQVEAESFDDFYERVSSYLSKPFIARLPSPRSRSNKKIITDS